MKSDRETIGEEKILHASVVALVAATEMLFTWLADPTALTQIADTLSPPATTGLLRQACERWMYSACLLFGLDLDEQARSGFRYDYSVYQVEYSRNLQFRIGAQMEAIARIIDLEALFNDLGIAAAA